MTNKQTYTYKEYIDPFYDSFPTIILSEDNIKKIEDFVPKWVNYKLKESSYREDPFNLNKRGTSGFGGEVGFSQKMNISSFDDRIGEAKNFKMGDLTHVGLPYIGIKTIEYDPNNNKFPLLLFKACISEIILFKEPGKHIYRVAGLYTPDIIRKYTTRDLVWDPRITTDKGGFYGIEHKSKLFDYTLDSLIKINNLNKEWIIKNKIPYNIL